MSSGELNMPGAVAHQILVVEDDAACAASIRQILEAHRYRVTVAKDGGQAHSSFAMHRPDFVILDLILPGESGFEICERIKQLDEAVPVLILSAIEMPDARALAERVGADGYLTKPFNPEELLESIGTIAQTVWERTHLSHPRETRRIRFSCRCGKRLKVSPVHRGRTLTCPDCGEPLIVPRHD